MPTWRLYFIREAILAVMFLLLVHMAYTHLSPIIFPYNEVFHSGKSSLTWLRRSTQGGMSNLKREGVVKEDESK